MARYDAIAVYDSPLFRYDSLGSRIARMKVKNGFAGMPDGDKVPRAQTVHTKMTGNANFTTPNPTLPAVQTAITAAQTANAGAEMAIADAREAVQVRRAALQALESVMSQLASYVDNVAAGDEAMILSSGFEVRTPGLPVGIPAMVTGLETRPSQYAGQFVVDWDPVEGTRSYEIQTTNDPNVEADWVTRSTVTRSSANVGGLPSGQRCWVRVRAIGSAGPGPWSDPSGKIVP